MSEKFLCPACNKEVDYDYTEFTYDVSGIPFRKLCKECEYESNVELPIEVVCELYKKYLLEFKGFGQKEAQR